MTSVPNIYDFLCDFRAMNMKTQQMGDEGIEIMVENMFLKFKV
jgi:hypothetical protein